MKPTWAPEPPTEEGYYWWRNGSDRPCVEYVYMANSGMRVAVNLESYDFNTFGGEWWNEVPRLSR